MDHLTLVRRTTNDDDRGADGQGIGVGVWLSLPVWLALAVIANFWP